MDRAHINNVVKHHTAMIVQSGPFAGMRLTHAASWGDGDISPKLLGTYEQELGPTYLKFSKKTFGAIVNIGCAEGYFAVGTALLFPGTQVFAYDQNSHALDVLKGAAEINGVLGKIEIGGFCGPEQIAEITASKKRCLFIIDCEGYEKSLFSSSKVVESVKSSDLIIEVHDFIDPSITASLFSFLNLTHKIQIIYAEGRNPNAFSFLANLTDLERWGAILENRPCQMHWLVCEARSPVG